MKIHFSKLVVGICIVGSVVVSSCTKDKVPPIVVDATCTDTISFSADILPIMQNNCTSCHDSNNASGGYDLSNHAGVTQNTAKVLGSMMQDGSASSMPQGAPKLADSLIQKVNCWINQGAKNN
jgi:hypothetical protein